MANPPIKKFKIGSVSVAVWENDFNGKKSLSFTAQKNKFNKESGGWETSNFFNIADMASLNAAAMCAVNWAQGHVSASTAQYQNNVQAQNNAQNVPNKSVPQQNVVQGNFKKIPNSPEDIPF